MLTIVFDPVFGPETQIQNLNAVEANSPVYLIFWGAEWQSGAGPAQQSQLITAAQKVINSSFMQATAQYGTGGTVTYGGAVTNGATVVTFTQDDLRTLEVQEVRTGGLPNGDTVTPTPLFVIVTRPGVQSEAGTADIGYNTKTTYNGVNYPTIWCSSNSDFSVPASGAVNVDNFSVTLSHEVAECTTDMGGGGFEVNPGPTFPNPAPNSHQIGDYEAQRHVYREYTGALVQSVWSRANNAFIVTDGTTQDFILNTNPAGSYDLVLNGDQPGHTDDIFYIDTLSSSNGDFVKAVINSEVAVFEPNSIRSITINTGAGTNTVYVARTVAPVTINGNANDTINLGVSGSVQGINGDVYIISGTVSKINVDDSSDPTNLHPAISSGVISSLLPNSHNILFPYGLNGANENLTLDTGSGASAVDIFDTIAGGSVILNTVQGTSAVNVRYLSAGGPLAVNLGGGAQNVNISPDAKDLSTTLLADVTVNSGTGTSTLSIDDDNATVARRWTITAGSVSTDVIGAGVVHYGRVDTVNLNGGYKGNTFTVQNTTNGLTTTLNARVGDTVDVLGTGLHSTVNVEGPAPIINVGNGGLTAGLHGLLHIDSVGALLNVDDSADLTGHSDVVIDPSEIVGLSDGAITYATLDSLSITGSQGGSTYHVLGTPQPFPGHDLLTTLTGEGTDTVNVGSNGSLAGVRNNLLIQNPRKSTNLTIDASADASSSTHATITNAAVTGLSAGAIEFDQSALSALNINGPQRETTYDVLSLPAFPTITTLNATSGDTVNIGQHGSLHGAWGNAIFVCSFSPVEFTTSFVILDGSLDTTSAVYTIGGNNNLTVVNATVRVGVTINGFRSTDHLLIDLQAGTINADLTQTSPGTISLDGTVRLEGTNPAGRVNVTVHARDHATASPIAANESMIQAFNTLYLIGTRPQDRVDVYDGNNNVSLAIDPIPAPYAQFAATVGDPASVAAGVPFDFTVVAQDVHGATLSTYTNQVQWYAYNRTTLHYFESDYESFPAADQGQHLFHGIVPPEAGTYSLGFDDGWNASSFTITVLATPQGGLNGESDGSSATPNIAAATSAAQPAADTRGTTASTPPVDASLATVSVGSDSVKRTSAEPRSVDIIPAQITPPKALRAVAHAISTDAMAAPLRLLPTSGNVGGADVETRDAQRDRTSNTSASDLGSRPPLRSTSFRIDALDEYFAHYDHGARSHTSKPHTSEGPDSWEFDLPSRRLNSTSST